MGQAELGDPGNKRQPPTGPATGHKERALSGCVCEAPQAHTYRHTHHLRSSKRLPLPSSIFNAPPQGKAVVLGSNKATPKIFSTALLWLALSALRHLTSRLA